MYLLLARIVLPVDASQAVTDSAPHRFDRFRQLPQPWQVRPC